VTERLDGLGDLAARFDHFLIDQFGVLLDGSAAYPYAPAALARLAGMGKAIVLLSNSGKRAEPNARRLDRLGFARTSYRMVMSSGECAWGEIGRRLADGRLPRGGRTLVISRDGDLSGIEGLDLIRTDDPAAADFVLIAGSEADRFPLAHYRDLLAPAAARGVPALCTNPDRAMLTPGGLRFGAAVIAEEYAALGGTVEYVGKPWPLIYAAALEALGSPDPARVVCVGDSPAHDVRGGRGAGMATALTRTGVHADLDAAALLAHCAAEGAVPDVLLPRFDF
jgi:HAD superfamily hydrolase (TIGR01459 family)